MLNLSTERLNALKYNRENFMRKFTLFLLLTVLVFSCDNEPDSCTGDTVLDRRSGLTVSPSYGLCIEKTCKKDSNEPCCSTGIIEEGKCLSGKKPGEECSVIADCESGAPVCLADPMILKSFIDKGSEMGIELTEEMLTDMFGLNYCTVMDCDPDPENPADPEDPVVCPEDMTCSDNLGGTSTGVFICQKVAEEEVNDDSTDEDPDMIDEEVSDTDAEKVYACMGEECSAHEDCPVDSCDATFCTGELPATVLGDSPKVCVVRCDPADDECPEGLVCNGGVAFLDDEVKDGAKGICVTPDSVIRRLK